MIKSSFVAFLLLIGSLYFSKAQDVRVTDNQGQSLEGVTVVFAFPEHGGRSQVVFSDKHGEARLKDPAFPMVRRISLIGFQSVTDTLRKAEPKKSILLQDAPVQMGEVTVTGNHVPGYQRDAVVPVQVLKASDFEKRGAVTVRDLVAQELNMQSSYDPSLGSSLTMQGTGGEHIKILIDGVPVIGRQNGNIDLGQLNLNDLERVEIVKGPMSVLYGTDALGGVLNLITKNPDQPNLNGSLSSFYESTGQYNFDGNLGWGFRKTGVSLSGGRNYFDGWDPEGEDKRSQLWNPREQYNAQAKLTHTAGSLRLSFLSDFFNEKVTNKSEPIVTPYVAYAYDQYYYTRRFNNQFSAEKKFGQSSVLNFMAAYSDYRYIKNTFRKDMVSLSEQLTPDTLDDDTTTFNSYFSRATYSLAPAGRKWNLLGGAEFNYETGKGKKIDGNEHTNADLGVFLSFEYKLFEKLTVRPAARFIYNSRFDAPVVPSLNLLYAVNTRLTVRSSLSMGYRAPSLKENYLFFVDNGIHNVRGNPDLTPERSRQFLASAEYKLSKSTYVFSVEPGVFYNYILDRISLVQYSESSTLYTYVNLDEFRSEGAELRLKLSSERFSVQGGIAYTGTWSTFEGDVSQPGTAWYPELNSSAEYKVSKTGTSFNVFWKYFGERPVYMMQSDGSLALFENDAYQFLDASVSQSFLKERISLTAGAHNLLDVTSVNAMSGGGAHSGGGDGSMPVAMGRSFFARVTFNLK